MSFNPKKLISRAFTRVWDWIAQRLGGHERAWVILVLAMAMGLDGADLGAIGSMSSILEKHFSITKSQIGVLIAVSKGAGVFSTLFFGTIVDRARRTRLLAIAVACWGIAIVACGVAPSFHFLLAARLGLGIMAAATLPCTASLIGDYFPGREWGRIFGYILGGEVLGTGLAFVVSGELAELSWRLGFWVLLLPSVPLAWWLYKLPEPERSSQKPLEPEKKSGGEKEEKGADEERLMTKKLREAHVAPRQRLVHDEDPACKSIWWAIRYALSVPTNIVLIICSAIGYAFFADIRTFGVQYAQAQYHLAHSFAVGLLLPLGIGALCGIRMGGWLGDSLLSRGRLKARVWVAMAFYWLAIILFCAGLYFQMMWLSVILFICSAFSLGAVNPPLDAARLDIIHPRLWGRAEAVRAVLRDAAEAAAPVSFGWLASSLGSQNQGLREAFLIMLIPLAIAGGLGFITFRTYPADAAAASAYREKTVKQASEKKK